MKVHYSDPNAAAMIASGLREAVGSLQPWHLPVYFCIGTPRIQGDALGPYVGDALTRKGFTGLVVGDSQNPATALTLECLYQRTMNEVINKDRVPYWIAVDACLGGVNGTPGTVMVGRGTIQPGVLNTRALPKVGDSHIWGTTGQWIMDLDRPAPGLVESMAQTIAEGLMQFDRSLNLTQMVTA